MYSCGSAAVEELLKSEMSPCAILPLLREPLQMSHNRMLCFTDIFVGNKYILNCPLKQINLM